MKRHFLTGLKAFAVSALALAAVSCYDDSELWGELEGLEQRVAALEEKLNSEVATLNSKIGAVETAYKAADADLLAKLTPLTEELDALDGLVDGYITSNDAAIKKAIEDYKKADEALAKVDTDLLAQLATLGVASIETNEAGNIVITFVDKSTVEVAAADANANNTGMITTVEVDGVTYWAVVGKDGKTTVLDAAVHPDTKLQFKVDPDTNELLVAYDGKTWEQTGVIVSDDTTINVVTGVEYNEGDDFVTIVVGEEEFVLPFYAADNSSLVLGRSEVFFMYGASKTIELEAEGIEEYYVMSKPDGWKATLEGTSLKVTAPAEELINMGAGELNGEVLVHATTEAGTCKVVKLDVETGESITLSFVNGNVNIFTAYAGNISDGFGDFVPLWVGLTPLDDLLNSGLDLDEYIMTNQVNEWDELLCLGNVINLLYSYGYIDQNYYQEGVCEELYISFPLADIVEKVNAYSETPIEFDENETYLLWIVPDGDTGYDYDGIVSVFTDVYMVLEDTESLYNNVNMEAVFYGADGFVVGATGKAQFDEWVGEDYTYEDALAEYLIGNRWVPGPLTSFNGGDMSAMGEMFADGAQSLTLEDVIISSGSGGGMPTPGIGAGSAVSPDTEYFVWVLPYYAGKTGYTFEDLVLTTVKTEPLTKDESAKTTINVVPGYTSVKYTITPPTGGKFDYSVLTKAEYESEYVVEGVTDEDALMAGLFRWGCPYPVEIEENQTSNIEPGTEYILITYSEADGHYAFNTAEFTTYSDDQVPVGKQWTTTDQTVGNAMGMPAGNIIDLGAVMYKDYPDYFESNAYGVAFNMYDLAGDESDKDNWYAISWGTFSIEITDATSGVIKMENNQNVQLSIPYKELDEDNCTFNMKEFLNVSEDTWVQYNLGSGEGYIMIMG